MNNREMSNAPLVSIITPSYNSSEYITKTYEALERQTHSNWEWLVTDDCSGDNTYEILRKLSMQDARVKPVRNSINMGAACSRNVSLERVTGQYIAFIDSDDLWLESKLENQIQFMGSDIDFSFTAYSVINKDGCPTGKLVDANRSGSFSYKDMLKKSATLGCSTVMLRRSAFDDVTTPPIRTGQDYALWLKLLKRGGCAHILGMPLTCYRITPNSLSRNKVKKALRQWSIYRDIECISLIRSVYYFAFYIWRAVFRR
jgi:glycosyltransferase involved in cell wall biosynthesis